MIGAIAVSEFGGPVTPSPLGPSHPLGPDDPDQREQQPRQREQQPRQREQQVRERAHEQQEQRRDQQEGQSDERRHPLLGRLLVRVLNHRR